MARINIEDSILRDQRFINLCIKLGEFERALGAIVLAWNMAQKFFLKDHANIPPEEWGKLKFGYEIIASGLAEMTEQGVYVKGSREQFAWLKQRQNAGHRRAAGENQRDSSGRWSKRPADASGSPASSSSYSEAHKIPLASTASSSETSAPKNLRKYTPRPSALGRDVPSSSVGLIRKAFCEAFKKEFARDYPGWGAKENAQAKAWLRSVSVDKAQELCTIYPGWNDPWVTERGHAFGLLITKYVELDAWANSSERLVEKIAQGKAVRSVDIRKAVEKEELRRGFENHLQSERARSGIQNQVGGGGVQGLIQSPTQAGLPELPDDPFSQEVFEPRSRSADEQGGGSSRPLPFDRGA